MSNQKHRDPLNSELREKFHKTLNDYKMLLDSKRKEFQKEKTLQLEELALNPDKASFSKIDERYYRRKCSCPNLGRNMAQPFLILTFQ